MLSKRAERLLGEGGIVILLAVLVYYLVSSGVLDLEHIRVLVENNQSYGMVMYVVGFVFLALLGMPVSVLIILATLLFGFWEAFLLSALAFNLSSISAFYLAKFVKYELVEKFHINFKVHIKLIDKVIRKIKKKKTYNNFMPIFSMRFILPNIASSYALGVMPNINSRNYLVATIFGDTLYSLLLNLFGKTITENRYVFVIGVVVVASLYYIQKIIRKKIHENGK